MLLAHVVTVETYAGEGSHGSVYGPPAPVSCLLSQVTQLVRAPDGREVTSSASYITHPVHDPPPGSRVTLPDGRVTTVITVRREGVDIPPLPANSEVMMR
ncbi:hypothetical protein B4N89_20560 [Embleya scabrispora]|uniref:Uncharacterized protein n=1 Tax=Embleya scabrispora TaxID=159449 RepID=A0A1T3P1P8_9ACTN|nr:hypothetical protein [Embleya scabrispora]OPC83008.1 hypothetical protein B4N89_20560 [Embleya scabrispora]